MKPNKRFPFSFYSDQRKYLFDSGLSSDQKEKEIAYIFSNVINGWEKVSEEERKDWIEKKLERMMKTREKTQASQPQAKPPVINAISTPAVKSTTRFVLDLDRSRHQVEKDNRAKELAIAKESLKLRDYYLQLGLDYLSLLKTFDEWTYEDLTPKVKGIILDYPEIYDLSDLPDIYKTDTERCFFVEEVEKKLLKKKDSSGFLDRAKQGIKKLLDT